MSVVTEHVKPNIDGRKLRLSFHYIPCGAWLMSIAPLAYDFELDE